MSIQQQRLDNIASEVLDILLADSVQLDVLDDTAGDVGALDARLQEVLMTRQSFSTIELAMYLRTSFSRRAWLPTWEPLLNASIEQGRLRYGEKVEDIFYGMMPSQSLPNPGFEKH